MPPLINVSMAITSPMLADGFSVIRRQQTVGNNGRVTFTPTTIPNLHGTVYPSSKNDLERFPNLQVMGKTITVITRFALRGESETSGTDYAPDIVQWHGDNFVVDRPRGLELVRSRFHSSPSVSRWISRTHRQRRSKANEMIHPRAVSLPRRASTAM